MINKALAALKEENLDWEVTGYAPNLLDPKALEETIAKIKEQYGSILAAGIALAANFV